MTSSPLDPILAEDLLDAIYPLFGMLNKVRSISAGKLGILSLAEEQGKITSGRHERQGRGKPASDLLGCQGVG